MERVAAKPKLLEGRLSEYKRPSNLTQRVTAIEDFFVISHMANADVDPAKWRLCIAGLVDIETSFALDDLRRYPKTTIECVHKCAASPREPWIPTRQVANVQWGGVDLCNLFGDLGVADDATHLWAYGLNMGPSSAWSRSTI